MEQQFCRILQGVIEYEKKSLGIVCVLFFIALIVIIVAVAMSFKKAKQIDRIIICCILFVFCGAFIGTLITNHHYRAALQADMDTCAFITYSGQMVHDDYQKDSKKIPSTIALPFIRMVHLRYGWIIPTTETNIICMMIPSAYLWERFQEPSYTQRTARLLSIGRANNEVILYTAGKL